MTPRRLLAVALALLVLAGCGGRTEVREPPLEADAAVTTTPAPAPTPAPAESSGEPRIWVVTHGPASSPFWAIVRNGVEAGARQMDALVSYRAPETYSLRRMQRLIAEAVTSRPAGLVVSFPEPGLGPAIRAAVREGIPVVTINSGSDAYRDLGVMAHVGQPEERAGLEAGRRLARSGARRALCVNQEVHNQGLDARCRGLARAMRAVGGHSRMLRVDDQAAATPRRIAAAVRSGGLDAVLTLNATTGQQAVEAADMLPAAQRPTIGTFDLGPDVLAAVRDGRLAFAVDQQAYLQGYLPIVLLAQRARHGLFPAGRDLIATGPSFVTRDSAQRVIDLSRRSIR